MTEHHVPLDWDKIQDVSGCHFEISIRHEIASNISWYRTRISDDFVSDASAKEFINALKAIERLQKTEFSRFQLEAVADELETVRWFLDVLAQAPTERAVNVKYFLYSRIWNCIGRAGVKLTQGKGIPGHLLSHSQKVFREICGQAGIEFTSDQALADVLKRSLKAVPATGAE